MVAPSATFKISSNGGTSYAAAGTSLADANALAYVASGTYSIKCALESTAGVSSVAWSIPTADDEHMGSLPTVTSNSDKTCTFSVPKTGGAWIVQAIVNGGLYQGRTLAALTKRLVIKVQTEAGQQVLAVGEKDEAGTYGWTTAFNDMCRATGGATGSAGGDLGGTYPNPSVDGLLGVSLDNTVEDAADYPGRMLVSIAGSKFGLTPTPSADGDVLVWDSGTSAWVSTALTGGAQVVYAQDGVAAGNVYTSFASALAAAQAIDGVVDLILDPTDGTPVIPSGTHDLQRRIRLIAYGAAGTTVPVATTVTSGAVLRNAVHFERIAFQGTLSTGLFTVSNGVVDLTFVRCSRADAGDTADLVTLATGSNVFRFFDTTWDQATYHFATLASGKNVTVIADQGSALGPEMFGGSAGTLTVAARMGSTIDTQASFSGTLTTVHHNANAARITDVDTPTSSTDAANKAYVDAAKSAAVVAGAGLTKTSFTVDVVAADSTITVNADSIQANPSAIVTESAVRTAAAALTAALDVNGKKVSNLATPTTSTDAATKGYADGVVTASAVQTATAALASSLSVNSQKITNLATPASSTDAATKGYVDSAITAALFSTTTNGNFTQPARGVKVDITLTSVSGLLPGMLLVVNYTNAYAVASISGSVATCISLGCLWDDPSGTTVASGSTAFVPKLSGLTFPVHSLTAGTILVSVPIEVCGMLATAQRAGVTVLESASAVTVGVKFVPRRIVDIIGVRTWTLNARTVKVQIWEPGGTSVASATAAIAANTPTVIPFSPVYTVLNADIGSTFIASAYVTSSSHYSYVSTAPALPNPIYGADVQLAETPGTDSATWPARFYVAGDGRPTTSAAGERYLVEPVYKVRGL